MGIPPFHGWLLPLLRAVRKEVFLFITTVHKLIPVLFLLILIFVIKGRHSVILGLLTMGVILLRVSVTFMLIVVFSSFVHSGWILLGLLVSVGFVVFYWRIYLIVSSALLRIKQTLLRQRVANRSVMALYWLILSGLPPFVVFWLKAHVVVRRVVSYFVIRRILLLSLTIRVIAYYRAYRITLLPVVAENNKYLLGPLLVLIISLY